MWYQLSKVIKRIFDIVASIILLIICSPIFIVLSVLIKADSEGPVFFRQERRGINGNVFRMYKFRSMVQNAEQLGSGLFNYEGDPRVTKIGRFMRNTSLDELPQFFNVLKGEMSFVGPRPCVVYDLGEFETLNRKYKKRFQVVPGITGLAQVLGRNDISWDEKVTYDNQYIDEFKKKGIFLDISILFKTFINVFAKKDIYEVKTSDDISDEEAAKLAEAEIIRLAHEPLPEDEEI